MPHATSQPKVGGRVALIVFWTIVLVLGVAVAVLVAMSNLADFVQAASRATIEAKSLAVAVAVAMFLGGLWGITSNHRALRHTVGLLTEVDRARTETIQLESARFTQHPK